MQAHNLAHATDFEWDQSVDQFRARAREFAEKELIPIAQKIDQDDEFPSDIWRKLGSAGLLGVTIPKEFGGEGLSYLHHVVATEELSRASAALGFAYAAHSNICLDNLFKNGTDAQRKKYLPKLVSGEHLGALSMSEPDAGSDVVGSMTCRAEKQGNTWIANGTKRWATNGPTADILIVYMRTAGKEAGSRCMTGFIVEKGMQGFTVGPKEDKLGMRGAGNCELYFNNCEIPDENVLGEVNQGTHMLMKGLDSERLILCGGPIGIMQAALDVCLPYVHERQQFGQPIGNFQMIQQKIADMYTKLHAARSMVYTSAAHFNHNKYKSRDASACCLFASEAATQTALDAIQLMGGRGYMNGEEPGRLLRDAKIYEIGGGTNEIRRIVIARDLLKESKP